MLASTTDTVFVNSTNISGSTETAMLSKLVRTKHIHDRREPGQVVTLGFSRLSLTPQNSECRGRVQTRKQKAPSQNTDTKIRPAGQKQESIHIAQ